MKARNPHDPRIVMLIDKLMQNWAPAGKGKQLIGPGGKILRHRPLEGPDPESVAKEGKAKEKWEQRRRPRPGPDGGESSA